MTASVQQDHQGTDWPLGFIAVVTPGTPVNFMSLVDPANLNDPATYTPDTPGAAPYTVRCNQIEVWALKPGTSHGTQVNAGNVYIVRKGVSPGTGNRDDTGSIVATLFPGQSWKLPASPLNRNVLSPYRYSVDADNAGDGVMVTLIIQ